MIRKIYVLLAVALIVVAGTYVFFFMPTNNKGVDSSSIHIKTNEAPIAIISMHNTYQGYGDIDAMTFSGKSVIFDGSKSYDPDGRITRYDWSFDDGATAQGKNISHSFNVDHPVIFSAVLTVYDDSEKVGIAVVYIKVIPSRYIFYFSEGSLSNMSVKSNAETKKLPMLSLVGAREADIKYNMSTPLYLPSCKWNVTLHIKKPVLSIIKKIVVTLYDENGNDTVNIETSPKDTIGFWKDRVINLNGSIPEINSGIAGIKISIYGFSIRGVSMIYGGDEPSKTEFDIL